MAVLGHSEENFKGKNQKRPGEKQDSELSAASDDQVLTGKGLQLGFKADQADCMPKFEVLFSSEKTPRGRLLGCDLQRAVLRQIGDW